MGKKNPKPTQTKKPHCTKPTKQNTATHTTAHSYFRFLPLKTYSREVFKALTFQIPVSGNGMKTNKKQTKSATNKKTTTKQHKQKLPAAFFYALTHGSSH